VSNKIEIARKPMEKRFELLEKSTNPVVHTTGRKTRHLISSLLRILVQEMKMSKSEKKKLAIDAVTRPSELTGSNALRKLRREKRTPAVLYGRGKACVSLSVGSPALKKLVVQGAHGLLKLSLDGKPQSVLIKDIQWDSFGDEILHADFIRVAKGERVTVEIPIVLHGEAPGTREGGILNHKMRTLELDCPVESIPEEIGVSLNDLHLEDQIRVSDIELPEGCVLHIESHEEPDEDFDPMEQALNQVVVEVSQPVEEAEEEPSVAEGQMPELVDDKGDGDDDSEEKD
jgi:large subunit ribosomal protein L25